MSILLNTQNPISRDEATAIVYLIESMEEHLRLTAQPDLTPTERAGYVKLAALAGVDLDPSLA